MLLTLRSLGARQVLAQEAGALGERLGVREHRGDLRPARLRLACEQHRPHGEVVLADDRHLLGVEGEGVEGAAHRALDRVLEGDQRPIRLAALDREDRLVDGRRAQRLELRAGFERLAQGVLGEGPRRPQVGDPHRATALFEGDRVAGFVVFGDLLARHGVDVDFQRHFPFGAGVSGIKAVAVSPAPMLLIVPSACCRR